MKRQFKSVSDALRHRMRHGMTQKALSEATGVELSTLRLAVHGMTDTSPKVLKKLGLRRVSVYEFDNNKSRIGAAPGNSEREQREPVVTPRVPGEKANSTIEPRSSESLSLERIKVAVRYGLNPRATWQAYMAQSEVLDWEQWCATHGTVREVSTPAKQGTAELYAHLKPIERMDRRTPRQAGRSALPVHTVQPMAITDSDST